MGSCNCGSKIGARLGGWSGGRPAGISVEYVMRGLGAGRLVLRKRGWRKVFVLRLGWSWECVFVVVRGIARPEGISVKYVFRGLEAGVSVLRKRFRFEICVLRLIGSWKGMLAVLRGIARPGGRPGGIIVKVNLIDFARAPGEPENFKNFEFFEGCFSDDEELRVGKIEWEHVVGTVRVV